MSCNLANYVLDFPHVVLALFFMGDPGLIIV